MKDLSELQHRLDHIDHEMEALFKEQYEIRLAYCTRRHFESVDGRLVKALYIDPYDMKKWERDMYEKTALRMLSPELRERWLRNEESAKMYEILQALEPTDEQIEFFNKRK